MNKRTLRTAVLAALCVLACALATPALGADDWRAEFESVCAKTDTAMAMTIGELEELTASCDRLQKVIDGLGATERKVFSRRLQMCRNLFAFVLETKRHEQTAE